MLKSGLILALAGLCLLRLVPVAQAGEVRLLAQRDSLITGYGLPARAAFPPVLEKML
ncbi:hypothetical protein DFAR_230007 [Desulfarculales bacterium]